MSVMPVGAAAGAAFPSAGASQVGAPGLTQPTAATAPTSTAGGAGGVSSAGDSFGDMLGNAIDNVQATQSSADSLANQAATGSLTNVADYMTTAEEANIQTQLTAAVRNSALQAFQTIMGMQL
jgi:flagellar hook-basal body complex protein FliE